MKHIITLMLLAIVVPELLTGSTPLSGFFNPATLLILFFGYGVAVLVIREVAVRNKLNFFGVFVLGFAYSILNEGLLAKTMLLSENIPIGEYDNYGFAWGVSIPWSLAIALFHATCSIIFPILVAHVLFPEKRDTPWLSKRTATILTLLTLGLSSMLFFGEWRVQGTVPAYLTLVALMSVLAFLGLRFKRDESAIVSPKLSWRIFWLGASTFVFVFLMLASMAEHKVSVALFLIVYVLGVWFYLRTLRRKTGVSHESLLLFILGIYFYVALQGVIFGAMVGNAPERIIAGAVALVAILWSARKLIGMGTN